MNGDRRPEFDRLERKDLLSASAVHPAPAALPLSIDGTLLVDVNRSSQTQNIDGSWTTTVPVSGQLVSLGKVQGVWSTGEGQSGNYLGPDTIDLQVKGRKGSFEVAFNNVNTGKAHPVSKGFGFYQHGQHVLGGDGAFARATEAGSIELMVGTKKGAVTSLVLITVPPTSPSL